MDHFPHSRALRYHPDTLYCISGDGIFPWLARERLFRRKSGSRGGPLKGEETYRKRDTHSKRGARAKKFILLERGGSGCGAGKTFREHCEIKGHADALKWIDHLVITNTPLRQEPPVHFAPFHTDRNRYLLLYPGRTRKLRTKFTAETIKEKRLNKIYLLKKW